MEVKFINICLNQMKYWLPDLMFQHKLFQNGKAKLFLGMSVVFQ